LDRLQSRRSDDPRRTVRDEARAPTRASMATASAEGAQVADPPTGRIDLPPPPRFDPILSIDPCRLAEINARAPGGSRDTAQATVVHPAQRRRVELSRFTPYPLPSGGVLIEPSHRRQPSRLHRIHCRQPQDLWRLLLHLQGASRSFLPH
jgi:hypothetical protein